MQRIILASSNRDKIAEFAQILKRPIVAMRDIGYTQQILEPYDNFYDNCLAKARAVYDMHGGTVIADDSGLCVDALNGEPGVMSSSYSGKDMDANIDLVLHNMTDATDRSARFVCCVVAIVNGRVIHAFGKTEGYILRERVGDSGFGYDPIFFSSDLGMSFGLATASQKNSISHRARAIEAIRSML